MRILSCIVTAVGFVILAGCAGGSDIGADLGSLLPYIVTGLVLMSIGGIGYYVTERRKA